MARKPRESFTQAQKDAVVARIRHEGATVVQAAEEVNASYSAVRRWLREVPRSVNSSASEQVALRTENARLKSLLSYYLAHDVAAQHAA